ncbi:MAG: hypothetical protein ACREOH_04285 [Candidatus Entotheonellia bacterium]
MLQKEPIATDLKAVQAAVRSAGPYTAVEAPGPILTQPSVPEQT